MDMLEERKVIISLICPSVSLSKLVQFMALEDERIDLGSISTAFGLDPLTIKINGHLISRGLDFIASSVTWKSLISFFSARGLSTGFSATDPLRVDGKLCKLGTKRVHDTGVENIIYGISEWGNKQPLDKDLNFLKKSKFTGSGVHDTGVENIIYGISEWGNKQPLDKDLNFLKKSKFTGSGAYMKKEHNPDLDSHQRKPQMHESNPEIYASSEYAVEDARNSKWDENGLKRKNQLNGVLPQKKMRMHETNLGSRRKENGLSAIEDAILMQL